MKIKANIFLIFLLITVVILLINFMKPTVVEKYGGHGPGYHCNECNRRNMGYRGNNPNYSNNGNYLWS